MVTEKVGIFCPGPVVFTVRIGDTLRLMKRSKKAVIHPERKAMKPVEKPVNPNFSSGPCSKRPGYDVSALDLETLGRSHRSALGKRVLARVCDETADMLGLPEGYRVGVVPASDTGAVEMALIRLASLPPGKDVSTLVRKLEEMERRVASGVVASPPAQKSSVPPPPEPPERDLEPPSKKVEAPLPEEPGTEKGWSGLVDFVKAKRRPRIASILEQVSPMAVSRDHLKVGFEKGSFVDGQLDGETKGDLEKLAAEYFGNPVRLETVYVDQAEIKAPPSIAEEKQANETDRAKRLRDDALNHPMVKTAIDVFEGEVVDVKPIDKGYV